MTDIKRAWSREEWNRTLDALPDATADDVPITKDGRRLDTAEKVLAWVAEVNAERERERSTSGDQARAS